MLKMAIPIQLSAKIQVTVVDLTVVASAIGDRLFDVVMVVGDSYDFDFASCLLMP